MGYFIHNKYDAASVAALASLDSSAHTVIDYYGSYESYKNLDTSNGFGIIYTELSYVTPNTIINADASTEKKSLFTFTSYPITGVIKKIQRGTFSIASDVTSIIIDLSDINVDRTIVLLNGAPSQASYPCNCRVFGLTSTSLTIGKHASGLLYGSYQVVEFY